MACANCLHYMVCTHSGDGIINGCPFFNDKSEWVHLPCKIGDMAWIVYTPKYPANPSDKGKWFMRQDGIQRILLEAKGLSLETWNMGTIPVSKINETIFFSREKAENALKEREKNE